MYTVDYRLEYLLLTSDDVVRFINMVRLNSFYDFRSWYSKLATYFNVWPEQMRIARTGSAMCC